MESPGGGGVAGGCCNPDRWRQGDVCGMFGYSRSNKSSSPVDTILSHRFFTGFTDDMSALGNYGKTGTTVKWVGIQRCRLSAETGITATKMSPGSRNMQG